MSYALGKFRAPILFTLQDILHTYTVIKTATPGMKILASRCTGATRQRMRRRWHGNHTYGIYVDTGLMQEGGAACSAARPACGAMHAAAPAPVSTSEDKGLGPTRQFGPAKDRHTRQLCVCVRAEGVEGEGVGL